MHDIYARILLITVTGMLVLLALVVAWVRSS